MQERKGKTTFIGSSVWRRVDKETGEIVEEREVDEFVRPVGRNEPFMITYLGVIATLIDSLGNKKMQVVKYILQHMDKSTNTLCMTTTEIASNCNVARQTVSDTLRILTEAGIVKRKTGVIAISPKLVNNKSAKGEATMMVRFQQFGSRAEADNEEDKNDLL